MKPLLVSRWLGQRGSQLGKGAWGWLGRLRRWGRRVSWLPVLGVFSASVLAVSLNLLSSRFYRRWDVTTGKLYTLSAATLETLHGLTEPVEILVFLGRSDPLQISVRHLLTAYGGETQRLSVRFVDPDRQPAELLALQQKYGILTGRSEDGRVITDSAMVIARGAKRWFITPDDLSSVNPEDGSVHPRLEQALTEGLRQVLDRENPLICFATGHREIELHDAGPAGLLEFQHRLTKNNYRVEEVDLSSSRGPQSLARCRVVVLAGPEQPLAAEVARRLVSYWEGGGNLFLLTGPLLDEDYRPIGSGLEPLARAVGVALGGDTVIEPSPDLKLPSGVGERFFALPKEHAATAGLIEGDHAAFRVLFTVSQSLAPAPDGSAQPILVTSPESFAVPDLRPFLDGQRVQSSKRDRHGPLTVALAAERLPSSPNSSAPAGATPHGSRVVWAGSPSVIYNQSFRENALRGNQLWAENSIAWLAAQPSLVSIPTKPAAELGAALTEESMNEVSRYVLLYMPVTSMALGSLILFRRRSREGRARLGYRAAREARKKQKSGKKTSPRGGAS